MTRESTTLLTLPPQATDTKEGVTLDELVAFPDGTLGQVERPLAWTPAATGNARGPREIFQSQSIGPQLGAGLEIVPAEGNRSAFYLSLKRLFDIAGAVVLLICFSPILLATFLVLAFTTGGKPLFRQTRLGHRGRPFTMYKFRSMSLEAESRQDQVENEQDGPIFKNRSDGRVTRIGRFLRRTSIDELPQLFNVLAGQMTLVGPRPPIGAEVAQYEPWQRRRLSVKPGLTCLWQVSGRSDIGFEQWVKMDIWYVEHQNFFTDLLLLIQTPWSVLSRRGAY